MMRKTNIRYFIVSSISNHGFLAVLVALLFILIISIIIAYHFKSPDSLAMTTGLKNGSYESFGERYRQILAREHVDVKLLSSSGAIENLKRLSDKSYRVDAGFVQDGLRSTTERSNLASLGAVAYSPIWVFYRSQKTLDDLSELSGKRIAIGPQGSGLRKLAIDLLKLNSSADQPTVLLDLSGIEAKQALLEGKADAVMIIGTEDNALVTELLLDPEVKLMNFRQAEAYTRLIPALSHVVLPQGILNIPKKLPLHDVHLLAVTTNLIIRKDLHPALIYLLLDAAVEIHSNAGWVNKKGEFPAPRELSFPSSIYAERFYKSGRPFLLDYLPFGLAAVLDRTLLIMVPMAIILIPLIRSIPWIYSWRHRRKFYSWYRKLKHLELELAESSDREDMSGYHEKIDQIEASINRIAVPVAFFEEVYKLQQHVDLVRSKLIRLNNRSKKGDPRS